MTKLHWVGCLLLLLTVVGLVTPQAMAEQPSRNHVKLAPLLQGEEGGGELEPWIFCVCCYFPFMEGEGWAYFYAHDCVNDVWVGYVGPPDTPIAESMCASTCPADCVSSPLPPQGMTAAGTSTLEPVAATSLGGGPLVYLGKGFGVHEKVRRQGLTEARGSALPVKLRSDAKSPYEAKLLDDCLVKIKLPGSDKQIVAKLALVTVRSKLTARVQEIEGVSAPTKVFGIGWEVKGLPADKDDAQVVKVRSSQVVPVGPSGEKTRTLWLTLPAGDFQVLTKTEVDVP